MPAPKPITVEYVNPEDYVGSYEPQSMLIVGDKPSEDARAVRDYLRSLPGFGTPFAVLTIAEDGDSFEWVGV